MMYVPDVATCMPGESAPGGATCSGSYSGGLFALHAYNPGNRIIPMIARVHVPRPPLAEYINIFWLYDGLRVPHAWERVLPTGAVELVINLHEDAIRSYDPANPQRYETLCGSVVAGARSEFMIIDTECQRSIMGVNFKPGGAFPFLGLPVHELCNTDRAFDDIWGSSSLRLRERLLEGRTPEEKFGLLEDALLARLNGARSLHPGVAYALRRLDAVPHLRPLAKVTGEIGLSQRRFIELFRQQVGMPPKLYYRIRRFQEALRRIERGGGVEWADLALACGYYDQSHFIRDFRAFSGINPSTYVVQRGAHFNHVVMEIAGDGSRSLVSGS